MHQSQEDGGSNPPKTIARLHVDTGDFPPLLLTPGRPWDWGGCTRHSVILAGCCKGWNAVCHSGSRGTLEPSLRGNPLGKRDSGLAVLGVPWRWDQWWSGGAVAGRSHSEIKYTNTMHLTGCGPGSTPFYSRVKKTFINLGDISGRKNISWAPMAWGITGAMLFRRPRVTPRKDSQETPGPWSQGAVIKREQ